MRNKLDGILARICTTGPTPAQLAPIVEAKQQIRQSLAGDNVADTEILGSVQI